MYVPGKYKYGLFIIIIIITVIVCSSSSSDGGGGGGGSCGISNSSDGDIVIRFLIKHLCSFFFLYFSCFYYCWFIFDVAPHTDDAVDNDVNESDLSRLDFNVLSTAQDYVRTLVMMMTISMMMTTTLYQYYSLYNTDIAEPVS